MFKNKSQKEFLNAIHTWFENKDENEIKLKSESANLQDFTKILQITAENSSVGLNFTPIVIINDYQFPEKYDREDIYYFISELIEDEDFN